MKRPILLFALALLSATTFAQSDSDQKTRDLGITISRFSFESIPFDLVYKWGQNDKFWRLEASYIGGSLKFPEKSPSSQQSFANRSNNIGLGAFLAREKRHRISDKFMIYHGIEFGFSGAYSDNNHLNYSGTFDPEKAKRYQNYGFRLTPRLGYSIGTIFNLNEHLYTSFELSPSLFYQFEYDISARYNHLTGDEEHYNKEVTHSTGFDFTQGAVTLGVFYTFTK